MQKTDVVQLLQSLQPKLITVGRLLVLPGNWHFPRIFQIGQALGGVLLSEAAPDHWKKWQALWGGGMEVAAPGHPESAEERTTHLESLRGCRLRVSCPLRPHASHSFLGLLGRPAWYNSNSGIFCHKYQLSSLSLGRWAQRTLSLICWVRLGQESSLTSPVSVTHTSVKGSTCFGWWEPAELKDLQLWSLEPAPYPEVPLTAQLPLISSPPHRRE